LVSVKEVFKLGQDKEQIQLGIEETQKLQAAMQEAQESMDPRENPITPDDLLARERTQLAMQRTYLANERTLLAYIRTAMAFLAGAVTLIQFFENKVFVIFGYILIPVAFSVLIIGIVSFYRCKKATKKMELIK
jgi:putative membrane protein